MAPIVRSRYLIVGCKTIIERLFYDGRMEDQFLGSACNLRTKLAQLNTVPLRMIPAGSPPWQALCDACFRQELGQEPWDELKMRPIRRGRR